MIFNRVVPGAKETHLRSAIHPKLNELVSPAGRARWWQRSHPTAEYHRQEHFSKEIKPSPWPIVWPRRLQSRWEKTGAPRTLLPIWFLRLPSLIRTAPDPGPGNLAPHGKGKVIYLPIFHGATGGPTENGPALADTVSFALHGKEYRVGRVATEGRQLYWSSRKRSLSAHEPDSDEGTERPADEDD